MPARRPSKADHDRVVRFIAANRFPFPGQTDWLPDNVTLTNETRPTRGIRTPDGVHYPDIVVLSGAGAIREIAEVETEVTADHGRIWRLASLAADTKTKWQPNPRAHTNFPRRAATVQPHSSK